MLYAMYAYTYVWSILFIALLDYVSTYLLSCLLVHLINCVLVYATIHASDTDTDTTSR